MSFYLGEHDIRCDIGVGDMLAELGAQIALDLTQVDRSHRGTGAAIDSWFVANNVRAERFRETTNWLAKVSLEELDDRCWEVKLFGLGEDVLLGVLVGSHPLGKVTDNF